MTKEPSITCAVRVVAVIATYHREEELCRLLEALKKQTLPLHAVVVADNASEAELQRKISHFQSPSTKATEDRVPISKGQIVYLSMPENRGCGAGLKRAEEEALLRFPDLTHFWILDDDVLPPAYTLEKLLLGLEQAGAEMICPLLTDEKGLLWGFPEPRGVAHGAQGMERGEAETAGSFNPKPHAPSSLPPACPHPERVIRQCRTPQEALEKLGAGPHPMWWCTGACVLVSRRAVDALGLHRDDYWMLGEDHEFSMRVGSRFGSVFITDVTVPHLPPPSSDAVAAEQSHYSKFLALLQNLGYNALWLNYSGPMWKYLPGNYRRFFQTFGFSGKTIRDAARVLCYGVLLGRPAGWRGRGAES